MKNKSVSFSGWIGAVVAFVAACGGHGSEGIGEGASAVTVIMPSTVNSPDVAAALKATQATAAMNTASDQHLNLIVRLFLDDGNMLSFYEPAPGYVLYFFVSVGGKTLDVRVPDYKKLSAPALYQALVPGSAIPDALLAAQKRHDALAATPHAQPDSGAKAPAASNSTSGPALGAVVVPKGVRALACPSCPNWCDFSCWQCRSCASGNAGTWCYQDAFNGAWANNNGHSDFGRADICPIAGNATLTIHSDVFNGNVTVGPQQDGWAWTLQTSTCFNSCMGFANCDENINFSVTGSGIDTRFGGEFNDQSPCD